jgi:hypothetical protein
MTIACLFAFIISVYRTAFLKSFAVSNLLRAGHVSVVIRRLVHHRWYGPAGERLSWAGTSWNGSAGQGPAMSHETGTRPKGFSYVYKYQLATQVE